MAFYWVLSYRWHFAGLESMISLKFAGESGHSHAAYLSMFRLMFSYDPCFMVSFHLFTIRKGSESCLVASTTIRWAGIDDFFMICWWVLWQLCCLVGQCLARSTHAAHVSPLNFVTTTINCANHQAWLLQQQFSGLKSMITVTLAGKNGCSHDVWLLTFELKFSHCPCFAFQFCLINNQLC